MASSDDPRGLPFLEYLAPVVAVVAHPAVRQACQESNLSPGQLLRAFGNVPVDLPIRTSAERTHRLQDFHVRFHDATSCFRPPMEISDAATRVSVSVAASRDSFLTASPHGPPRTTLGASPWCEAFLREAGRMQCFSDHLAFDAPCALLLLLPPNIDPRQAVPAALESLQRRLPQLAPHVRAALSNPDTPRLALLCHTSAAHSPPPDTAQLLATTEQLLGASRAALCTLGTRRADDEAGPAWADRWDALVGPRLRGGGAGEPEGDPELPAPGGEAGLSDTGLVAAGGVPGRGARVSEDDVASIQAALSRLVAGALVPVLEERCRSLSQALASRRGLKNQLKSWFSGRPKDGSAAPLHQLASEHGAVALAVQDYDAAASSYRVLVSELKGSASKRHLAGAHLLHGAACLLAGAPHRETHGALTSAAEALRALGPSEAAGAALAAALLAWATMAARRWHEAVRALILASFEEQPLRGAVLLEQAADCYKRLGMRRKWALHAVLAGHKYRIAGQASLGVRSYLSVEGVYLERGWDRIEEHMRRFLLGRAASEGDDAAAAKHAASLLSLPHPPPHAQQQCLGQLLDLVGRLGEAPVAVEGLTLPRVSNQVVAVRSEGRVTVGTASADASAASWTEVEGPLLCTPAQLAKADADLPPPPPDPTARLLERTGAARACVAGEDISIAVLFTNPLRIPLDITGARLVAELTPDEQGHEGVAVELPARSLVLEGRQDIALPLAARPLVPGRLVVRGVEWELCGKVSASITFPTRAKKAGGLAEHDGLTVCVLPPMPRLSCRFDLPERIYTSELRVVSLAIVNSGPCSIQALRLSVPSAALQPLPTATIARTGAGDAAAQSAPRTVVLKPLGHGVCAVRGADDAPVVLDRWEELRYRAALYCAHAGHHAVNAAWYFEPGPDSAAPGPNSIAYRTLRIAAEVVAAPALRCQATAAYAGPGKPKPRDVEITLAMKSAHGSRALRIAAVSAVRGPSVKAEGSDSAAGIPGAPLVPGATATLHVSTAEDTEASEGAGVPAAVAGWWDAEAGGTIDPRAGREAAEAVIAQARQSCAHPAAADAAGPVLAVWWEALEGSLKPRAHQRGMSFTSADMQGRRGACGVLVVRSEPPDRHALSQVQVALGGPAGSGAREVIVPVTPGAPLRRPLEAHVQVLAANVGKAPVRVEVCGSVLPQLLTFSPQHANVHGMWGVDRDGQDDADPYRASAFALRPQQMLPCAPAQWVGRVVSVEPQLEGGAVFQTTLQLLINTSTPGLYPAPPITVRWSATRPSSRSRATEAHEVTVPEFALRLVDAAQLAATEESVPASPPQAALPDVEKLSLRDPAGETPQVPAAEAAPPVQEPEVAPAGSLLGLAGLGGEEDAGGSFADGADASVVEPGGAGEQEGGGADEGRGDLLDLEDSSHGEVDLLTGLGSGEEGGAGATDSALSATVLGGAETVGGEVDLLGLGGEDEVAEGPGGPRDRD
ncbi:unnamed protein product [Pedinophyceae sp. YPF-701]|nr:unnamed protein product [Pedinophyceae sp. YPF-701]